MRSRASASMSARETTEARSSDTMAIGGTLAQRTPATLSDDVEVGEAGEHRLAADRRVPEGDDDLLVAPGELRAHDDSVAPAGVADPIAVTELALAGDHGTCRRKRHLRPRRHPERPRPRPTGEGLAPGGEIATRAERLAW